MGTSHQHRPADLFLVRVWAADIGEAGGPIRWHGKVQRVMDGEAHTFSDWLALIERLEAMLPGATSDQTPNAARVEKERRL